MKLLTKVSFLPQRFEHKTADKLHARKIDAPIRFPAALSMAPYTTLVMNMKEGKEAEEGSSLCVLVFLLSRSLSAVFSQVGDRYPPGPEAMYEYDLFVVINHEGQINNGHYTNFARFQDEVRLENHSFLSSSLTEARTQSGIASTMTSELWFLTLPVASQLNACARVSYSNLGAVLDSAAYMCFYVKRHLDYKNMTPSYALTRETEAVREKEMEREKEAARMKEVEDALLATV
jgi:ubiquitin carboxyl-terminal hydrolase 22/27/51